MGEYFNTGESETTVVGILLDEDRKPVYASNGVVVRVLRPHDGTCMDYEEYHGSAAWQKEIDFWANERRAYDLDKFIDRVNLGE